MDGNWETRDGLVERVRRVLVAPDGLARGVHPLGNSQNLVHLRACKGMVGWLVYFLHVGVYDCITREGRSAGRGHARA